MENEIKKENNGPSCCSGNESKKEEISNCGCGCSQEGTSCCGKTGIIIAAVILIAAAVWFFIK